MRIDSVALHAWRSYAHAEFGFREGVNIICGDNGRGKTNLLEALWMMTGVRSWRTARKNVLVHWDEPRALLRVRLFTRGRDCTMQLELPVSGRSTATVNGVRLPRQSDLSQSLRCVLFSPEDLALVRGPASGRRAFIDDALCQMRPRYAELLERYEKLLDGKSRLLRDERQRAYAERLLPDYDAELARVGAAMIPYRARFCAALAAEAAPLHGEISGGREQLTVQYQTVSSVTDPLADGATLCAQLAEHLERHHEAEMQSGTCLSGLHKDELLLSINGRDARAFASQGQTRSAALSLKFAVRALFDRDIGEPPVLLLDDVLSELDAERRAFVARHAVGGQTILTCCEQEQTFPDAYVIAL